MNWCPRATVTRASQATSVMSDLSGQTLYAILQIISQNQLLIDPQSHFQPRQKSQQSPSNEHFKRNRQHSFGSCQGGWNPTWALIGSWKILSLPPALLVTLCSILFDCTYYYKTFILNHKTYEAYMMNKKLPVTKNIDTVFEK